MPNFRHAESTPGAGIGRRRAVSTANNGLWRPLKTLRIGMMVAHNTGAVGLGWLSSGRRGTAARLEGGRYCCNTTLGRRRKARVEVLRISVEKNDRDLSLILEGRLVGPWVEELQRVCGDLGGPATFGQVTVDLCGVTAMDASGQALLDRLLQRGATLRCSDVMNQYWVEQIARSARHLPEACRPCRSETSGSPEEPALASS